MRPQTILAVLCVVPAACGGGDPTSMEPDASVSSAPVGPPSQPAGMASARLVAGWDRTYFPRDDGTLLHWGWGGGATPTPITLPAPPAAVWPT